MAKRTADDNIMMRPLPSARVPWLVVLLLLTCIVLIFMGFLRSKDKLLGPAVPEPDYLQFMRPRRPAQVRTVPTPPAQPTPAPTSTPPGTGQ